ncbi:FAD:protein FMN transferase [Paenibacillus sp. TRM 82003]|nr:FAD:protein FMN transferase [Paenibacillus sp. TRM 82003]
MNVSGKRSRLSRTILLLSALLIFSGCSAHGMGGSGGGLGGSSGEPVSETYFIFDTIVTVKVFDGPATEAHFAAIRGLLEGIDATMNRNLETSEIARVNAAAGREAVQVSEETFGVVAKALAYADNSGGRFDPTIGPLVDLWNIGGEAPTKPGDADIERTAALVDYRNVVADESSHTLYLKRKGMSLDLGAIAKGYAGDVVADYLKSQGMDSAIIDLGGNVLATGLKPDGSRWKIGVQDPSDARGASIATVLVENQTVVSSGVYERYFVQDGVHYHHIFDPTTGYPVDNDLLSVTIVTDRSADADALSTTVFSLGLEEGMAYVESQEDVDAVLILENKDVYISSGLQDRLTMTDPAYRLLEQ